jgi:hypothetical protein
MKKPYAVRITKASNKNVGEQIHFLHLMFERQFSEEEKHYLETALHCAWSNGLVFASKEAYVKESN